MGNLHVNLYCRVYSSELEEIKDFSQQEQLKFFINVLEKKGMYPNVLYR